MLITMGKQAKTASRVLAVASTEQKNRALEAIARALEANAAAILEANGKDLENGRNNGMSQALLDRLKLDEKRIAGIAAGVREVMALEDPVGRVLEETVRPNGLRLVKVSVPLGVIGIIFEARPNVSVDSAVLCLKSGNAVILRGGSDAICSNTALVGVMRAALESVGLPADCVQLIENTERSTAVGLMKLNGYVDVIIPRGGAGLIQTVVQNATVPVIETGAGTCHLYIDKAADLAMAAEIAYNAKTSRPSVCNAIECLLVHRDVAPEALELVEQRLQDKNVEFRADARAWALMKTAVPAHEDDWGKEYNDYILAVRVVDSVEEASNYVNQYGTGHSECIVTADEAAAAYFMDHVDAAAVYHNASTRFTDGGEFGLGAEIGISTQKLHARGPMGLRELTSMKYRVYGNGQIR